MKLRRELGVNEDFLRGPTTYATTGIALNALTQEDSMSMEKRAVVNTEKEKTAHEKIARRFTEEEKKAAADVIKRAKAENKKSEDQ